MESYRDDMAERLKEPRELRPDQVTEFVVCGTCRRLRDGIGEDKETGRLVVQRCSCDLPLGQRAESVPLMEVEFCQCCAIEILPFNSKWSVWFCDACLPRVKKLNHHYGRCLVPIGQHTLMNGVFIDPSTPQSVAASADQLHALFRDIKGTVEGASRAVLHNLIAAGLPVGEDLPAAEYLGAMPALRALKRDRFQEMVPWYDMPRF